MGLAWMRNLACVHATCCGKLRERSGPRALGCASKTLVSPHTQEKLLYVQTLLKNIDFARLRPSVGTSRPGRGARTRLEAGVGGLDLDSRPRGRGGGHCAERRKNFTARARPCAGYM